MASQGFDRANEEGRSRQRAPEHAAFESSDPELTAMNQSTRKEERILAELEAHRGSFKTEIIDLQGAG